MAKKLNIARLLQILAPVLCALAVNYPAPADAQVTRSAKIAAQFTIGGTEGCLRCHGAEHMTLIASTPHGNTENPDTPAALQGCESCHGPGSLHVSRARGGTGFPALLRFGDRDTRPQQTKACLDCHANDMGETEGMRWAGSLHDTPRITCVTCHVVHTTDNPMRDPDQQSAKCARCHSKDISKHPRFEEQGIMFDELICYDCHDVHQLLPAESQQVAGH